MGKGKRLRSLRKAGTRTISKDVQDERHRLTESRDASIKALRQSDQFSEAQLVDQLIRGLGTSIQIIQFNSRYHTFPPNTIDQLTQAKAILQDSSWKSRAAELQSLVNWHLEDKLTYEHEYDLWMDDKDYINFVLLLVYRLTDTIIRGD